MASTYTSNTGIEKIGSGEQAGAWGTTTNNNFDIIDRALNGSVTLTITENKHVKVMKELAQAINQGPNSDGAIVLFDAESGTSFSSDVSAIAIAVAAAD